jgi:hypothetical protein
MILEERCYTLAPGNVDAYWACYTPDVIALMAPLRDNMLGYFVSDTGTLNQIVHLWRFESYEERAAKRGALAAEHGWQEHLKRLRPLCTKQETRILRPSPLAALAPLVAAGGTRNALGSVA